jgi:hypothetical protein
MSGDEKRMVGNLGYEVRQALRIGGKEIVLGENRDAADNMMYLVGQYTDNGIIEEYSQLVIYDDYLEALEAFTGRIDAEAGAIKARRDALGLPTGLFTAKDCYPLSRFDDIKGRVIAINSFVLAPEYRRGDVQLVYAVSGGGTAANSRGSAVCCYHLNDGTRTRFERCEVLGVVKKLPDWALAGLERIRAEMDRPAEAKEFAGSYEITERIEVGLKVFALGHCEKAAEPFGTWQGRKGSCGDLNWGHYFSDYESARADMHDRAAKEQRHIKSRRHDERER